MIKILMRAQINHDNAYPPKTVLLENMMGGNCGNWLYQYSLYRTLLVDENVQIDVFDPKEDITSDEYIAHANETYDFCVIPLANAFKTSFAREIRQLTTFVNKLKIPCIVPCVGIQTNNAETFTETFKDKEASTAFIKAVLNKSSMIGVRGEVTASYLQHLGFTPEKDFTVVGCPSMYLHGAKLPEVKNLNYNQDSLLLFNSKVEHENKKRAQLLSKFVKEHPNYVYVPQRIMDMRRTYFGMYLLEDPTMRERPDRFFDYSKALCFTSPYRWIDYAAKNVDLSIGTRLHGNIACILGGVPSFIISTDQRVSELAKYHNIQYIPFEKTNNKTTIRSIIENADFTSVHKGHAERFNHYIDMLEKNGLTTAFSKDRNATETYFDSVLSSLDFSDDILSFDVVSDSEKIKRTQDAAIYYFDKSCDLKERVIAQRKEIKLLQNKNQPNTITKVLHKLFK